MHIKVRGGTVQHGEQSLCYSRKRIGFVRSKDLEMSDRFVLDEDY